MSSRAGDYRPIFQEGSNATGHSGNQGREAMWIEGWGELPGCLIVVSGPSGSGKTSIVHRVIEKRPDLNLQLSVSATTRDRRPGEVEGKDYYFITRDQFKSFEFFEFAEYNGNLYGTSSLFVYPEMLRGKNVILEIEIQGATQVRKLAPESLFVFVRTPAFRDLGRRLRDRGTESPGLIHKRLVRAREELAESQWYDAQIVNDKLDDAVEELATILDHHIRGG